MGGILELGWFGFAFVNEGLLDVIGGIELGGLLGGWLLSGFLVVAGENAAVFSLDGPQTSLVVHLRPREFSHPWDQIWISARPYLLCRGHCYQLFLSVCLSLSENERGWGSRLEGCGKDE